MTITRETIRLLRPGHTLIDPQGVEWQIVRFNQPDIYCQEPYLDLVRENGSMKFEPEAFVIGWKSP